MLLGLYHNQLNVFLVEVSMVLASYQEISFGGPPQQLKALKLIALTDQYPENQSLRPKIFIRVRLLKYCVRMQCRYVDDESYSENGQDTDDTECNQEKQIARKTRAWVKSVNDQLDRMLAEMTSARIDSMACNDSYQWSPGMIRVFGTVSIPQKKFNAETDVTHRRMDYCLPADFLYAPAREGVSKTSVQSDAVSFQEFCDCLPSFHPDNALHSTVSLHDHSHQSSKSSPSDSMKAYLLRMKQVMKRITTQPNIAAAQLGKDSDVSNRKTKQKKVHQKSLFNSANGNEELHNSKSQTSMQYLKQKRYHNFCPKILAHDFLLLRRVDRMYHCATIRGAKPSSLISSTRINGRPFIIFLLTGDIFLQEQ